MRLLDFAKNSSPNTQKKLTYVAVGAWNTLFSYVAFLCLYYLTHDSLHYMLVLVLSQIVGLTNAYICYKFLVFKTKGNYLREYLRFYVVYGTTFIVNLILIGFFVEFIGLNPVVSQALIAVLVVAMAYFGHSRFSFKSN
ncbi:MULTISPECIES: GtrA family protein [Methylotenera]|uniref:GtrA family protein n=1 Tax=Methylotenera TaxID=359407 RepID=UPI0009DAA44A|nr:MULTISPECIES: GtrA family protein [Methylotenera]